MKKLIKIAEARAIAKNNPHLDVDDLMYGIDWLNKGDMAPVCMIKPEYNAVALYLISREINAGNDYTSTKTARAICAYVTDLLGLPFGYCEALVRAETAKQGRILIAELNTGLDHITLTNNNPYFNTKSIVAI